MDGARRMPRPRRDPEGAHRSAGARAVSALDRLPAAQRQVMELVFGEGLAYAEVASRLGVPETTVRIRMARARARLARADAAPAGAASR